MEVDRRALVEQKPCFPARHADHDAPVALVRDRGEAFELRHEPTIERALAEPRSRHVVLVGPAPRHRHVASARHSPRRRQGGSEPLRHPARQLVRLALAGDHRRDRQRMPDADLDAGAIRMLGAVASGLDLRLEGQPPVCRGKRSRHGRGLRHGVSCSPDRSGPDRKGRRPSGSPGGRRTPLPFRHAARGRACTRRARSTVRAWVNRRPR